ncbi:Ankyrin repeat domain-containing protein 17, partial [Frankliniella fusca]
KLEFKKRSRSLKSSKVKKGVTKTTEVRKPQGGEIKPNTEPACSFMDWDLPLLEADKTLSVSLREAEENTNLAFPPLKKIVSLPTQIQLPESLLKDLQLSEDSEEEEDSLNAQIKKLEVEVNKISVEEEKDAATKEKEEVEEMEKEIEAEIVKEKQAIKEIEERLAKIKEKEQRKEDLTCGGVNLKMPWKLIKIEDIMEANGRLQWLSELPKRLQEEKGDLKVHPHDPKRYKRCRKCHKRFHVARDCPNK